MKFLQATLRETMTFSDGMSRHLLLRLRAAFFFDQRPVQLARLAPSQGGLRIAVCQV